MHLVSSIFCKPSPVLRYKARSRVAMKSLLAVEGKEFQSLEQCIEVCNRLTGREHSMLFFSHTLCPYAERVWLALLEKVPTQEFVLVHIDLSDKPRWYVRDLNPRGLVPSVLHHGQVYVESMDICHWVYHGDVGHVRDPGSNLVSALLDAVSGDGRYWGVGNSIRSSQVENLANEFDNFFASCGFDRFDKSELSIAEISVFPFVYRAQISLQNSYKIDIREMSQGKVGEWMDGILSNSSSASITCANRDLLLRAFERHKSLDFFDYDSYGIFDLHPHLQKSAL